MGVLRGAIGHLPMDLRIFTKSYVLKMNGYDISQFFYFHPNYL